MVERIRVPSGALLHVPLSAFPPHTLHPLSPAEQVPASEAIYLLEKQGSFKKNNNFDKFIRGPISSHKHSFDALSLFPALPKGKGFSFIGFLNDTSLARREDL